MSLMKYNANPISLREGKIFLDGVEVYDGVKCEIKITPDVWQGRQLGERTQSSRWLGMSITGTITRRRATAWLKDAIDTYLEDGTTPEFTIQGLSDDTNSDYYAENGSLTVTCVGCVLTGDLTLISLDADGDVLDDSISFNAKDIV